MKRSISFISIIIILDTLDHFIWYKQKAALFGKDRQVRRALSICNPSKSHHRRKWAAFLSSRPSEGRRNWDPLAELMNNEAGLSFQQTFILSAHFFFYLSLFLPSPQKRRETFFLPARKTWQILGTPALFSRVIFEIKEASLRSLFANTRYVFW